MRIFIFSLLVACLAVLVGVNAQSNCAGTAALTTVFASASANNAAYVLDDGRQNPNFVLATGQIYSFVNLLESSHPLFIKTSPTTGTGNQYLPSGGMTGQGSSVITFVPDKSLLGTTLYYICQFHPNMQGTITFVDGATCATGAPATTSVPATTQQATTGAGATTAAVPTTVAPTTAAVSTLPGTGWQYVGCRVDYFSPRILANKLSAAASRAACQAAAVAGGYTFYSVQNGFECWADNTLSVSPSSTGCTTTCQGNALETCGGVYAADVFQYVQAPVVSSIRSSAGTFAAGANDLTAPVLNIDSTSASKQLIPVYAPFSTTGPQQATMATLYLGCTTAACTTYTSVVYLCIDAESCGYVGTHGYFTIPLIGVAGNTVRALLLVQNNGAAQYVPITVNKYVPTVTPSTLPPTQDPTGFIGCYSDFPRNFNKIEDNGVQTPLTCRAAATAGGYTYFAVEYGTECWAGNSLPPQQLPSSSCNVACPGNPSIMCGGSYVASVYWRILPSTLPPTTGVPTTAPTGTVATTAAPTTATPTTIPADGYMGCFSDFPRNFNKIQDNGAQTPFTCRTAAATGGYTYFALEYGTECWAGNSLPPQSLPSSSCNVACPGSPSTMCGGSYTASVYLRVLPTTATPTTVAPTTTLAPTTVPPTTAAPTTIPASGYIGCFGDYPRNFNKVQDNGAQTPLTCRAAVQAAGYTYFALEYGTECWGGNNVPSTTSTGCTMACPGNPSVMCGGSYTASVYIVTVPSTATPTTATPTTVTATTQAAATTQGVTVTPTTTAGSAGSACNFPDTVQVSAVGTSYTFNALGSAQNPALVLVVGKLYSFINLSSSPFYFKTQLGTGTGNQVTAGVTGNGGDVVQFAPQASQVGQTLYYQSSTNAAMSGSVTFVSGSCP